MSRYPVGVLAHFREPANLGPLAESPGTRLCRGEAGSSATGAWVRIEAAVRDVAPAGPAGVETGARGHVQPRGEALVEKLAFRAWGCPYLIAACSRVTVLLAGGPIATLANFDPAGVAAEFATPAEKYGSLLILQDALRNCFRDWDTTQPAAAR